MGDDKIPPSPFFIFSNWRIEPLVFEFALVSVSSLYPQVPVSRDALRAFDVVVFVVVLILLHALSSKRV